MWSRAGLCVLGLLFLHSPVLGQDQGVLEAQQGVLVFCDDPNVEKAVSSALDKFNEKVMTGHKLALYQILDASKSENGSGLLFTVHFSSRTSDCPAGSDKPWTECNYLPDGHKDPIACNTTVFMTDTETETIEVECLIAEPITSELAQCLGCPQEIDATAEELKVPLSLSVLKYNIISDSTHLFKLNEVGYSTRQVVAGFRYKMSFDMRKSTCTKAEHTKLSELCVHDNDKVEFAHCNSTVDIAPWRHENPEANVECEPGALPPTLFTRRRPPGWSPLRHFANFDEVQSSSPSPTSAPSVPNPTAKKESSEEDDPAASKPSSSPDVVEAAADSPFHCPSKPWKMFNPVQASLPADPTAPEPAATMDGSFSDQDLLG